MHKLKKLAEDPKCEPKNILKFSKEIDPNIAFSSWYRDDQTIKPRGTKSWNTSTNRTTPEADFEPDAGDFKTATLNTLQITSSKPRVPGIYFTDPKNIEDFLL